ncbi:multicopper oxidase domain-containing protein [Candidatus Nitronereus thalassa]|uniref:Copper-containing nitrite reductase n=1 Tax=Candidatus Nitronereus thalassa TaxID=3020898 RepID=A0ABU3K9U3_9BACT|nr:multicopper oxidase domain-containing protein [Candidatus Nitronereus thalassa]MDT7043210.1 multicopper oxidase domain-containing protein [Candidatus Nitronereus thalassa]
MMRMQTLRPVPILGLIILGLLQMSPFISPALAKTVKVELTAIETEVEIDGKGTKYKAWTFNGQFPGPVVRVTEGDEVHFILTNAKENSRPHSMDFHAAETNFLDNYREINPGEALEYVWKAKRPGVFAYHCGAFPMIQHLARGMVGAVIVDPKDSHALPKPDREYVLVQTELYLKDPDDVQAFFDRRYDHVVFNGGIFKYDPVHASAGGSFLEAKPGERVRFFFVNGGPNNFSALHPIAEIWDDVWESGNPANRLQGVQTFVIGPAGGAILDVVVDQAGIYPIVTHSLTDALRGAIALLEVKDDAKRLALMPFVQNLTPYKIGRASSPMTATKKH